MFYTEEISMFNVKTKENNFFDSKVKAFLKDNKICCIALKDRDDYMVFIDEKIAKEFNSKGLVSFNGISQDSYNISIIRKEEDDEEVLYYHTMKTGDKTPVLYEFVRDLMAKKEDLDNILKEKNRFSEEDTVKNDWERAMLVLTNVVLKYATFEYNDYTFNFLEAAELCTLIECKIGDVVGSLCYNRNLKKSSFESVSEGTSADRRINKLQEIFKKTKTPVPDIIQDFLIKIYSARRSDNMSLDGHCASFVNCDNGSLKPLISIMILAELLNMSTYILSEITGEKIKQELFYRFKVPKSSVKKKMLVICTIPDNLAESLDENKPIRLKFEFQKQKAKSFTLDGNEFNYFVLEGRHLYFVIDKNEHDITKKYKLNVYFDENAPKNVLVFKSG